MTDLTPRQQALATAINDVYDRQHPAGNVHLPEWDIGYLGVSTIVKESAYTYAHKLKCQKDGVREPDAEDHTDGWWAFKGNATADAALHPDDGWVHEGEFEVPVPGFHEEPFTLRGHMDGIRVIDGYVVANEYKSFIKGNPQKNDKALRQGLLGLALMKRQAELMLDEWPITREPRAAELIPPEAERGASDGPDAVRFYPIEFTEKGMFARPEQGHIDVGPDTKFAGVVRSITEETPSPTHDEVWVDPDGETLRRGRNTGKVVDGDELDAILDYYLEKSRAILEAVKEDDLDIAMDFDMENAHEFAKEYEKWDNAPANLFEAYAEYEYAKERKKEFERRRRKASAKVQEALQSKGVQEAEGDLGEVELKNGGTGANASAKSIQNAIEDFEEGIKEDGMTVRDVNELISTIKSSITPGTSYTYPSGSLEVDPEELVEDA